MGGHRDKRQGGRGLKRRPGAESELAFGGIGMRGEEADTKVDVVARLFARRTGLSVFH